MQRNEIDSMPASSEIGLGTPELWQRLSLELDGKAVLDKPRVSKKVLLKATRMQTDAMRFLVDEFDRLQNKISEMEREAKNSQKHVERVNAKLITLQGQFEEMTTKVHELEVQQAEQTEQFKRMDDLNAQLQRDHEAIDHVQQQIDVCQATHAGFADKMERDLVTVRQDQELTKQFAAQLEDRMNAEEKELFLNADHILHNRISLAMWMDQLDKENKKKDDVIREFGEKMGKQAKNVQDMMLETRRTLDDNTCAVEDVQRLLLLKADRAKVDEAIESKYEEICNQLDKALAAVIGEEDEFKRVSQELQQLVTHLSDSKADRKDLLEIKEQVLYDSRVRQQVENLRSFIDLKMNREDVFSALKNKADKDEMATLLKALSEGMNASIQQAQRTLTEADTAFLTGKSAMPQTQKRGCTLPSLERERCLSCNSMLRGPAQNKSPFPMAPTLGGGFQLPPAAASPLPPARTANNNARDGPGGADPRAAAALGESASEGFLLGVDGHVYQGDPELLQLAYDRTPSKSTAAIRVPTTMVAQRLNEALQEGRELSLDSPEDTTG